MGLRMDEVRGVVDALRSNDRFVVVTHENPDGDALGSMLATTLGLQALGKDVVMYLSGDGPLPAEYEFLDLTELRRALPDDLAERVVVAVDCANERRIGPDDPAVTGARLVVNIDHHHDNTRFGGVNLIVADASSTAEIVRDVLRELDVELTPGSPRRSTSGSSPTPAASSTRTRRRRRFGSPPTSSRPAPTCTASSGMSTRPCSSRS